MKKHYFLGLAAGRKGAWRQLLTIGRKRDVVALTEELEVRYGGRAVLCKNGRSALALALKSYCDRGDVVLVNGFTCYAVYEAVKAAGMRPMFVDINRETLNYDEKTLGMVAESCKAIIVQNTLGNVVDMVAVEKIAKKRGMVIIEDLAHSAGRKYVDGREAGTVGAATVLSFGKEKVIDTISGGAVVLRDSCKHEIKAPSKAPDACDYLRERWYPALAAMVRGLSRVHLGGVLMRAFIRMGFVAKSADNRLDLDERMPKFEAKLAFSQLRGLRDAPLREFYLVDNRAECLKELKRVGYHFDGFWYEKPVAPERYYAKVGFNEAECPVATEVAEQIVNFPTYYARGELAAARKIVKKYEVRGGAR